MYPSFCHLLYNYSYHRHPFASSSHLPSSIRRRHSTLHTCTQRLVSARVVSVCALRSALYARVRTTHTSADTARKLIATAAGLAAACHPLKRMRVCVCAYAVLCGDRKLNEKDREVFPAGQNTQQHTPHNAQNNSKGKQAHKKSMQTGREMLVFVGLI